jgi:hypothetical protein
VIRRLALALTAAAALVATGCGVNDYCLNCGTDAGDGDAIVGDATADGNDGNVTPPDACVPTGVETCNGMDDDCDGQVDERRRPASATPVAPTSASAPPA